MLRPVPKPTPKAKKLCKHPRCKNRATEDYCKMHGARRAKAKTRKTTGEKQLFERIWEQRPHVSEISGQPLLPMGHPKWHWQFMHVLPKGTYPELRLCEENIILATPEEHNDYDHHTHRCKCEMWDKVAEKRLELIEKTCWNI